ncbi:hypothetical protein HII36_21965 [Nonomuraea sp. NN258]|uniref:hypothetical protein n=1 Tax=Nonomuraea antri TaxID=2730852 RepID=UPI0015690285|nr:hypothetical protein [Nonomuraea antri]NRQ34494.1 hypothetical protein [Nonomuraea antri]
MSNADQPVAVTQWPVPGIVTQRFPEIDVTAWAWDSPLRLRAQDACGVVLVVLDKDRTQLAGQRIAIEAAIDRDLVATTYAALHAHVVSRTACADGTPLRAEHDRRLCRWCGLKRDEHFAPWTVQRGESR